MSVWVITTSWPRFLAGAGVFLVMTFTFLKPGISQSLSGGWLLLFWTLHVGAALVILQCVQMGLMRLPGVARMSPWLQIGASGLIGAVLFMPVAAGFDLLLKVDDLDGQEGEPLAQMLMDELTGSIGPVLTVWVALNVTRLLQIQTVQVHSPERPSDAPAFWERVPVELGRDLVALSAELHYLRVFTSKGEALILYPFGQAVDELEEQGMQIHRSHWVAFTHIAQIERQGQNHTCITSTGLSLPVSRRRKRDIDAALHGQARATT